MNPKTFPDADPTGTTVAGAGGIAVVSGGDNLPSDRESGYRKTILDCGIRIVTESIPQVRSVALGFWFDVGSRDEPDDLAGISHFLEHMNFKGTPTRSPATLVRQIEGRGGHLNAFTSKEVTCFHARIVDSQLNRAVDVLADMTQNSVYEPVEIDKERGVIIEELKNIEDTPDDLVFEHFVNQVFNGHSLGRSIIGRRESLKSIDQERLFSFNFDHYGGGCVVIAAAGNVEHMRLVRMIERRFRTGSLASPERFAPPAINGKSPRQELHTNTQQAHICWGFRSLPYNHPQKYPLLIFNTVLGGGMSSRLFQQVREKHGLAYSVFSFVEAYSDTGLFGVYAGCESSQAKKALSIIKRLVKELARKPVSKAQLKRTKDQLKGSLLLSLESPSSRMHRLARSELYIGKWRSLDDIVAGIDAVTQEDIIRIVDELISKPSFTTILWPNQE